MRTGFVVLVLFGSLAGHACADEPVTLLPPTSATLPEAAPKASQGVYYQHNGQWWYLKPGNRWYVWDGTAWQKSATGLNLTPQVKPGLGSTTPWNSTPVRPPSTMTVYDDTAPDPRMTVDSELLLYRQQPDYWGRGYPAPSRSRAIPETSTATTGATAAIPRHGVSAAAISTARRTILICSRPDTAATEPTAAVARAPISSRIARCARRSDGRRGDSRWPGGFVRLPT